MKSIGETKVLSETMWLAGLRNKDSSIYKTTNLLIRDLSSGAKLLKSQET